MKSGSTMNFWTEAEDAKLAQLRADGIRWMDMPRHMPGRTIQACQQRQLYLKLKAEGKRKTGSGGARKAIRKRKARVVALERREKLVQQVLAYETAKAQKRVAEQQAEELRRNAEQAANARRSRRFSTSVMATDAELRSRVEMQGLTSGLLGDPMPGRSALDQRNQNHGATSAV